MKLKGNIDVRSSYMLGNFIHMHVRVIAVSERVGCDYVDVLVFKDDMDTDALWDNLREFMLNNVGESELFLNAEGDLHRQIFGRMPDYPTLYASAIKLSTLCYSSAIKQSTQWSRK